ncbi:MAG: VCBS repeat-containing protein [Deltaproteobacteria bacterium]|nr:MAG: VCBS repeat-containing protein [Deltaproteobacteria bacterium]
MVLISSTSKKILKRGGVFSLLLILFFSCSKIPLLNKKKPNKTIKPPEKVYGGPSKPAIIKDFKESAAEYGLAGIKGTNFYAVDFDGDFHTDLVYLPNHYSPPEFMRFNPTSLRFEKLGYNPFPELVRASYLTFADLDKDGLPDVFVNTLNQKTELTRNPPRLYRAYKRGDNIYYSRILNDPISSIEPTASAVFFDFDLDGHLDLYLGNWFDNSGSVPIPKPDRILKGEGFNFRDVSRILEKEWEYSSSISRYPNAMPVFGVTICDLDQNGYPDVLASVSSGYKNKMWMNISTPGGKDRMYRDYGEVSGFAQDAEGRLVPRGGGNSFYSACADYNNDGIMDLAVGELSHSYDPELRDRSAFLTGSRFVFPPKFIRTEYHMDDGTGVWNQGDRRGSFFDYDLDGLQDLIVDNSGFPPTSRLILFKQEENHAFIDVASSVGIDIMNPSGTILVDVNKDGREDILTGQTKIRSSLLDDKIYLYQNEVNRQNSTTIKFWLRGEKSNADGLGALVILKTDKNVYRRYVQSTWGPLPSQNEGGILFAFRDEKIESLDVRWPYQQEVKGRKGVLLTRKYSIGTLRDGQHNEYTLCESGVIMDGRVRCSLK